MGVGRRLCAAVLFGVALMPAPASSAARLELSGLRRAAADLARGPRDARALGPILELAALRPEFGATAMLAALRPAVRRWRGRLERLELAPLALRRLLGDLARRSGDRSAARWIPLPGEVTDWSWSGPLPTHGGAAFAQRGDGERSPMRQERAAGRDGPVRWRRLPAGLWPSPRFGELIDRPSEAVVYAETGVHVPDRTEIVAAALTSGKLRLYLDGRLLLHRDKEPAPRSAAALSRPLVARAELEAGWHCLRAKLADSSGRLELAVALQRADGRPLSGLAAGARGRGLLRRPGGSRGQADLPGSPCSGPRAPRPAPEPGPRRPATPAVASSRVLPSIDPLARLCEHARPSRADAALRAIVQATLQGWSLPPSAASVLDRARAAVPLAAVARAARLKAPGDRLMALRRLLSRVISAGERITALLGATRALVELERPAAAHAAWQAAGARLGHRPSELSAFACLARVDLWLQLGAELAALTEARACAARWPRSLQALHGLGRLLRGRDDRTGALAVQRRIVALAPTDPRELLDLVALATTTTGTIPPSIAALVRGPFADPALRRLHEILARTHLAAGRPRAARDSLDRLPTWQWRAATFALSSRIARSLADRSRAITDLRTALRRAPGRDDYRARLRLLVPGARFYGPYRDDLLRLARHLPPSNGPIASALSRVVIRQDGARQARYEAELLTIGKGGPDRHSVSIDYVPSRSTLEVLTAAVLKRDGRVVQRADRELRRLGEGDDGLYGDLEALTLRFSELEAGDVVILEYVIRDFAPDPFGMVLGELFVLGDEHPVRRATVIVELPTGSPLYHRTFDPRTGRPLAAGIQRVGTRLDKGRSFDIWRLSVGPLAAVPREAAMPGVTEVAPYLHLSSFPSWAAVGSWYRGLVEQALEGAARDPAIGALARRLASTADHEAGRVRAVYRYVADHIRYVGLEFGVHSLKPHDAAEVLARRFGDCKDKATLIVALLRRMGIGARVALVRTGANGAVGDGIASLAVFDHAIARVPSLGWWLDATQQYHAIGELPALDVGGMALRIPAPGEAPPEAPDHLAAAPARANLRVALTRATLAADGSARAQTRWELRGLPAAELRRRLHAESVRVERLEAELQERWPGAVVSAVRLAGVEPPEPTVRVSFRLAVPGYARASGHELVVRPFGAVSSLLDRLVGKAGRRQDLELPRAFTERITVRITPPAGWKILTLPEPVRARGRHAELRLDFARRGREVEAKLELVVPHRRIPAADHNAWRRTLRRIDERLRAEIRLAPAGSGS